MNSKSVIRIFLKIAIVILTLLILGTITVSLLVYSGVVQNRTINNCFIMLGIKNEKEVKTIKTKKEEKQDKSENKKSEPYNVETLSADSFFEEYGNDTKKINVEDSDDIVSEMDAYKMFTEKGFNQASITSEYLMNGEHYEAEEIDKLSKDKHPMYSTYYTDEEGNMWCVSLVNDRFIAVPISYNLDDLYNQVAISESNYIMGYDANTNKFFETKPDESTLQIIEVNSIDSKTLNSNLLEE